MTRRLSMGYIGLMLVGGCFNPGDEQKSLSAFLGGEGPVTGACCILEYTCEGENCPEAATVGQCIENSTPSLCSEAGGAFYENAACDETPCFEEEEGNGCCLPNGSCIELSRETCLLEGGAPSDASCANTECEEGGEEGNGCCLPNGSCIELSREDCLLEGGAPSDASCANTECEEGEEEGEGACCVTESEVDAESCSVTTRSACQKLGGEYAGDETTCEQAECGGEEEGNGCCLPDGSCADFPPDVCLKENGKPSDTSCANTECEGGDKEPGIRR